jgi:hypothetical protein
MRLFIVRLSSVHNFNQSVKKNLNLIGTEEDGSFGCFKRRNDTVSRSSTTHLPQIMSIHLSLMKGEGTLSQGQFNSQQEELPVSST